MDYPNLKTNIFNKPIIVVEGIIGAGKTTLTQILEKELDLKAFYEPVDANLYLKEFYAEEARIRAGGEKPNKYAFPMQMELMYQRFAMHKSASWEVALFNENKGVIIDRSIFGDRVFAKLLTKYGNIEPIMWDTYQKTFFILSQDFMPPQYMIYLDTPVKTAWIRARGDAGRNREQETPMENDDFYNYLIDLKQEHENLIKEIEDGLHSWSKYIEIIRVPWENNLDPEEVSPVIKDIKSKINL
ncbi:MAG: deoxynucleoside kinase [Candidatus Kariarchaeum pelagius]|tara:strand:+ start:779 stop:1507 length:729 start_codon:yes stop_codon:yes gene_type:complete